MGGDMEDPVSEPEPDPSAQPRRNAAATRARLLQAAREQFLRQGYRATSLRAIAAQAGVDVMLIRRYFGSKEQLFTEATEIAENAGAVQAATDEALAQTLM